MKFIGREKELKIIKKVIDSSEQENILIYGRRRIGKSFLIKKALEHLECKIIHYQCKEISLENTLEDLTKNILDVFNIKLNIVFNTFDEILDFLFKQNEKVVFVIDEYPYLLRKIEGLDSIIQNKIDMYKYSSSLKLIISGSQIDIMKDMLEYAHPLYGRFNEIINLKEHNYLDTSKYYLNYPLDDKVKLYSVFGGEPLFNSKVLSEKTVIENIVELMIKEDSFIELTINNLLNSELSKVSNANDVLLAIALGARKNEEIVAKAHLESSAKLNPTLKYLLKLDLIEKRTPINDKNNKKKTLYYIKNNAFRFYYRYIYKNYNARNNMNPYDFYKDFIEEDFENKFIPYVFEDISKQYLLLLNMASLIKPFFAEIGSYWYDDKASRTNGQFDIVTMDKNGYIFYEVKYSKNKVNQSVVNEEISQLNRLNMPYYNLGFISKSGFDLKEKNEYILITLEDIYDLNLKVA